MQSVYVELGKKAISKTGVWGFVLALSALSIIGRVVMAPIPNVQPSTAIIMLASMALGTRYGVVVAVTTAVGSNMFLGQGPWTLTQALAWGTVAILAGFLHRIYKTIPLYVLAGFAALMGYLYGFVVSSPVMAAGWDGFWMYYQFGLLFDTFHAASNAFFFLLLAKPLLKVVENSRA